MRKTIAIYLSLVVIGTILYGLTVFRWIDSKAVGPHAFPGSPDWAYMYGSSLERYFWLSGVLFGLALGGVALFAYARSSPTVSQPRWKSGMMIASIVILVAALAVGYSVEQNTLQGEAAVGESGSKAVERIVAEAKTPPQRSVAEQTIREQVVPTALVIQRASVAIAPMLSIKEEFLRSKQMKSFFDKHLPTLSSASGETKFFLAEALQRCRRFVGRSLSTLPLPPLIESGQMRRPNYDARLAVVQRLTYECEGFENYEMPKDQENKLLEAAAKQGYPGAQAATLLNLQLNGKPNEAHALATSLLQGELDPFVLRSLLDFALLNNPVLGDPPIRPKRDQYADAWQLAMCDFGMDCGANSRALAMICMVEARCGANSFEDYLSNYRYSPMELPEVMRLRQVIHLGLQQRNLAGLGIFHASPFH